MKKKYRENIGGRMFAEQYKGRKVFITGHTGFKGSWLCAWLLSLGAEVCGYSLDIPTSPSGFESMGISPKIKDLRGDVQDANTLAKAIEMFQPEIIFHLAAQALVRPSYEDPAGTFMTNAIGTMNVLEAARKIKSLKAIVSITSDKCYHNNEWEWGYRETDALGGEDPYSASKACAEIIAHSYFVSFFAKENAALTATVRAGNVIGGGDWALDRIVPDCARAYAKNEAVFIRSPLSTRPWQHVLEPLSGYLWLGAKLLNGVKAGLTRESFNFGPSADVNATVKEVTSILAKHWSGFSTEIDPLSECSAKECNLLKLCCDKSLNRLKWKACLTFEETLRFTAEWYEAFYYPKEDHRSMEYFTQRQIDKYVSLAKKRAIEWTK